MVSDRVKEIIARRAKQTVDAEMERLREAFKAGWDEGTASNCKCNDCRDSNALLYMARARRERIYTSGNGTGEK